MGALLSLPGRSVYADLAEKTGFSCHQINVLHKRFKQLSQSKDTLRKEDFEAINDLALNPIRSEIITAFFDRRNFRQSAVGMADEITFEEFLLVMSHFRPPRLSLTKEQCESVKREKLRFLFNMHDTDNNGTITTQEYRCVVEELLSHSGPLEKTVYIADAAMQEVANTADVEPGGFFAGITFEHFYKLLSGFDIEHKMSLRF
uniref:Calcineurin B homologous protein 3 n=1 Tax=Neogobius melanostomus TaxID=47308 RepID=A0A8C6THV2_9GOBI